MLLSAFALIVGLCFGDKYSEKLQKIDQECILKSSIFTNIHSGNILVLTNLQALYFFIQLFEWESMLYVIQQQKGRKVEEI